MFEDSKLFALIFTDRYRICRHLILQSVIFVITIGNFFDAPDRLNFTADRFYSWIAYYLFLNMIIYFNVYVLFHRYLAKGHIARYILAVAVFMIFSFFLMMMIQDLFYDIAVMHTQPSVVEVVLSILSSVFSLTLFLGGSSVYMLMKNMITNTGHIDEMKHGIRNSELTFLKSQINPHFLFNMINNANILADDEPENSARIIRRLDEIIRYQLNDSLYEKVPLCDDINFLNNYLLLEKTRRDNFNYTLNQNGGMGNISVPPLIFIPFVENAVKHNVTRGAGYVYICFSVKDNILKFICRNSISENKEDNRSIKAGGLGLENINKRLDLLFKDGYKLEREITEDNYEVRLTIVDLIK